VILVYDVPFNLRGEPAVHRKAHVSHEKYLGRADPALGQVIGEVVARVGLQRINTSSGSVVSA
jgi:hypothetical protein